MRKTTLGFVAVLAAAGLALSGCSGSGDGSQAADAGAVTDGDQAGLTAINAQPRENLQEGGTLTLPIGSMPSNWNQSNVNGNEKDIRDMTQAMSPAVVLYSPEGEASPNPDFIESWEVAGGKDGEPQVVTLKLNKDAKFNNGNPITAAQYANILVCNGADDHKDYQCASTDGINQIEKIEAGADEYEAVITFKSTYPDWTGVVGFMPDEVAETPEAFNTLMEGAENFHNELQAGPFVIDSVDTGQQLVTMVPNDKWWGDKPLLEKIVWKAIEDASAVSSAFANSEIDVISGIIDADGYEKAQLRADAEVRQSPGLQWRHFTVNSTSGVLQDKAVRQAVSMGIDRASITGSDLAGMPIEAEKQVLGNHFFMPGQKGYKDNSGDYAYNPEKAMKVLDEAGWKLPEGKKFREKDGKTLSFEYVMMPGIPTSENEGRLLQADMEKIGIEVKFINVEPGKFFEEYVIPREFAITTFTWVGTPYPMANVGQIYGCTNGEPNDSNFAALCLDELEELRAMLDVEMDPEKRIDMVNKVDELLWENVHTIPIYARVELTAVPKNLANYGAFYLTYNPNWQNVGFVKEG